MKALVQLYLELKCNSKDDAREEARVRDGGWLVEIWVAKVWYVGRYLPTADLCRRASADDF